MHDTSPIETNALPPQAGPDTVAETGSEELLFQEALIHEPLLVDPSKNFISEMKRLCDRTHKYSAASHLSSEIDPPNGISLESRMEDMVQAELAGFIASRNSQFLEKYSSQLNHNYNQALGKLDELLETLFPLPNVEYNLSARLYWK